MAKNDNLSDFLTDIANAIRTKKGSSGVINAQDFSDEILSIPTDGGGGEVDEYYYYAKSYYTITNNSMLFPSAWQDSKDSENVLFDIPLMLAAPNQDMGGISVDLYVGTNEQLQELYDDCVNGTIPPPITNKTFDVYYVNDVATFYGGDISGSVGFPIPLYSFGVFGVDDNASFLVGDLTPLGMGLGLVLAKGVNVSIPNNNIVIKKGFEFENESGIIIPNGITSIGRSAFQNWTTNNQPLVIPNSVINIGQQAFQSWTTNNQPLVIPNSVTSIGVSAFGEWTTNNQPLVIPNSVISIDNAAFIEWTTNNHPLIIPSSVQSIGQSAFYSWKQVPYVIMESETPPTLGGSSVFSLQNDAPIYVPDSAVDDYKNATNWSAFASRIFPISEK